jgi:hypothetical protein
MYERVLNAVKSGLLVSLNIVKIILEFYKLSVIILMSKSNDKVGTLGGGKSKPINAILI